MTLSNPVILGIVILTLVAVAYGGTFVLRVVNGTFQSNELQRTYYRAGHAHAGMLVTLGLLLQVVAADPRVPEWGAQSAFGVLWAAILMPAGFFLSVTGRDPIQPNGLKHLIWIGGIALTAGLVGTGAALISVGF